MSPGWDAAALHGVEKDFNVSWLCCCLPFVLGGITADIDREDWTFAPESRIAVIRNHRRGILWIEPSPAMGEGLEGGSKGWPEAKRCGQRSRPEGCGPSER